MDTFTRGLILVKPYGSLTINKKKTIIIKTKNIKTIVNTPLLLIEDKFALGFIKLSQPTKINLYMFNKLKPKHLIPTYDRIKWWPSYTSLYSYKVIYVKKFRMPAIINYPVGPQITIKPQNITFKKIMAGMSGYYYKDCYPDCKNNYLECYSKYFSTVEINNTFYKTPSKALVDNLSKYPNMIYSIKVSRQITHNHKLNNIDNIWNTFYTELDLIKNQIKCFLFQFSHMFHATDINLTRLSHLKKLLKGNHYYVFEFRHSSWFNNKIVSELFKETGWVFVIANEENLFVPNLKSYINSSNILYFRMHGSKPDYQGRYNSNIFKKIIEMGSINNIDKIFVYFDNTDSMVETKYGNTLDAFNDCLRFNTYVNPLNN